MTDEHGSETGATSAGCPICGHQSLRWLPRTWALARVAFCIRCPVAVQLGAIDAPASVLQRYRRGDYWRTQSRLGRNLEHGLLLWREVAAVRLLEEIEAMLGRSVPPGTAVLEVGCGPGELLSLLRRERICQVWGLEPSPREAYLAQSRHGIRVVSADGSSLPYRCSFNLILAFHVLEHVSDPVGVVRELLGLLSSGGQLVLECPNIASPTGGMPLVQFFEPAHIWTFSHSALERIVYLAGGVVACRSDSEFIRILVTRDLKIPHPTPFTNGTNTHTMDHGEAVWRQLNRYASTYPCSWSRAGWVWSRLVVGICILMLLARDALHVRVQR